MKRWTGETREESVGGIRGILYGAACVLVFYGTIFTIVMAGRMFA